MYLDICDRIGDKFVISEEPEDDMSRLILRSSGVAGVTSIPTFNYNGSFQSELTYVLSRVGKMVEGDSGGQNVGGWQAECRPILLDSHTTYKKPLILLYHLSSLQKHTRAQHPDSFRFLVASATLLEY